MNKWYRLDNAAKVFPSVSNKRRSNIFRLSFTLKEEVNPEILEKTLISIIERFPSFKVKLKRGLFWYYFEENKERPLIYEENPYICKKFNFKENNGYLFKVSYYQKRISLETFHSLTDGFGALELLKSIVYKYLVFLGKSVESENLILTEIESRKEEDQDSFVKNYHPRIKADRKESKALKLDGSLYKNHWTSLIVGTIDVNEFKEVIKSFNATVTEFISSCLIYSASRVILLFENKKKPFQLLIPVNLRRFFNSKSLRNFSLYIKNSIKLNEELTFEEIMAKVKEDFKLQLTKERLHSLLMANVKIEKNILMRLVPLFIKELALKIGYNAYGDKINSMSFSNLGQVELPKSMVDYIDNVVFANGASFSAQINCGVISMSNKLTIAFSSAIEERYFQREFFRLLANFGLNITIQTNELEV